MANELSYEHGVPMTLVYAIANVAADGITDGALAGVAAANGFVVPANYAFHPLFLDIESNEARTAGTAVVKVTADGTELAKGPGATLDGTNTTRHQGVKRPNVEAVVAGEEVGVSATADASWAPATADIDVVLVGVLLPA